MHIRKMAAGTETEHARSVSHCVLHLFLNLKQRTKLETVNSDGIYFRSSYGVLIMTLNGNLPHLVLSSWFCYSGDDNVIVSVEI